MKIKKVINYILGIKTPEELKAIRVNEANSLYNITEIEGQLYVTFRGIAISRESDSKESLVDRLLEMRSLYVNLNK